jgi:hypothetical protein
MALPAGIVIGEVPVGPPPVGSNVSVNAVRVFIPTVSWRVKLWSNICARGVDVPDACTRIVSSTTPFNNNSLSSWDGLGGSEEVMLSMRLAQTKINKVDVKTYTVEISARSSRSMSG